MTKLQRIMAHPNFDRLSRERARLGATLATVIMTVYFLYILVIAFRPGLLAAPIWSGAVTTWGVVAGVGVIALGFLLTAIYVRQANARFDTLTNDLLKDIQ